MATVYTIGHSTREEDEFLELLRAHGIRTLVDVRRFPGSRRYPQFGQDTMRDWLSDAGIGYTHEPELGGRRKPDPNSPNTAWRNAGFRAYADHMNSLEFEEAIARVLDLARAAPTAVMCAEAVPWRCHRRLIADALVANGHEVRHILSANRLDTHALHESARIVDGRLIYPADGASQPGLFETGSAAPDA